jgi:alpha 1,3-glucosidase
VEHVYGIPQHADTFSLKDTSGTDPYRLYNLDVFEYELWNPMALYAAIPFMMGHGGSSGTTTGLFWLNAAEGWIDIKKESMGPERLRI